MSIIQDALKKVQTENEESKVCKEEVSASVTAIISENPKKNVHPDAVSPQSSKKIWVGVWVAIIVGIFAIQFLGKKPATFSQVELMPVSSGTDASAKSAIATKIPVNIPRLKLSGITFGEGASVAIINNNIVNENDMIEGAIVVEILPNDVRMSYNGYEFMLRLQ